MGSDDDARALLRPDVPGTAAFGKFMQVLRRWRTLPTTRRWPA